MRRQRERGARREEGDKSSERSADEQSYKLRSVPGGRRERDEETEFV